MPKCHLCNDFQRSARQFRFTFDCSEAELSQSTNSGCVPCSFLLEGLRRFEPKLGRLKDHDRIYVCGASVDGDGTVEMEVFSAGALKLRLEFFVTKGKASPLEGARMLPTIPGDTRALASMDWAKQRLQQCVDSHVSCGQRGVLKLPTRVLEIGSGEEDIVTVRLLETHGVEAQYACLSHRWSRPAGLVTKLSNAASHLNGIDWKTLPRTFKEAILITKDLGLRYLWIDSLCIVQDDIDDKQREIAKMSLIYTNSYITIAATHSNGETHGCYSAESLYHQDHRLLSKQSDANTAEIDLYVRERIAHIGEQGAMTPLLQRGWVHQERLLSPRVIHFCEKELVWECQESSICQCSCFDPPIRLKERYSEIFRGELAKSNSSITINNASTSNLTPINIREPFSISRARSRERSLERSWDRHRERSLERSWDRHRERSLERSWDRHRERSLERSWDRHRESSLERSRDRHRERSLERSRDRHRERYLEPYYGELAESNSSITMNNVNTRNSTPISVREPLLISREREFRGNYHGFISITNAWRFHRKMDQIFRENENPILWRWHDIVSDYSNMDLTNRNDRLPAIAGLASQFGEVLNSKYLAGLWQTVLPNELLWRTDYTIEPGQHRSQYRAPSWSWASVDGKIKHYRLGTYDPEEFSVVRAVCNPVSNMNPFGEVRTGWLEVNALTVPFKITLDLSEGENLSRRRVKVESLTDSAIFVPDYDISVGAAARYAHTCGPHQKEYRFLCVGNFYIAWSDAVVTPKEGPHRISLVVQRIGENRYERVGIIDCHLKEPKLGGPIPRLGPYGVEYRWNSPEQWSFQEGLIIV